MHDEAHSPGEAVQQQRNDGEARRRPLSNARVGSRALTRAAGAAGGERVDGGGADLQAAGAQRDGGALDGRAR